MTTDLRHTPRLYVDAGLAEGKAIGIEGDQAHYLQNVMRMKAGDALRVFNGRDGEWLAHLGAAKRKSAELVPEKQLRPQKKSVDVWLCPAPIKKAHFEYMVEKATELGISALQPVLTGRTQVREMNEERFRAIAVESAEQSERLDVPEITKPLPLPDLIAKWPKDRAMIVCAETGDAAPAAESIKRFQGRREGETPIVKFAVLTGPEGGFAAVELEALRQVPNVAFIRLGPRILRADTAAIAALTLWQSICGDWKRATD